MKPEEIEANRREVREILEKWRDDECLYPKKVCEWCSQYCVNEEEAYKCLYERLSSLGVVLADPKGELPENPYPEGRQTEDNGCLAPIWLPNIRHQAVEEYKKSLAGYHPTYELEGK